MLKSKRTLNNNQPKSGAYIPPAGASMSAPDNDKDKKRKLIMIVLGVLLGLALLVGTLFLTGVLGGADDEKQEDQKSSVDNKKEDEKEQPKSSKFTSKTFPTLSMDLPAGWTAQDSDEPNDALIAGRTITASKDDLKLEIYMEQTVARDYSYIDCVVADYYDNLSKELYRIEDGVETTYQVGAGANKEEFEDYVNLLAKNKFENEGVTPDYSKANFCPDGLPMGVFVSTIDFTERLSPTLEESESGKLEFVLASIKLTGVSGSEEDEDKVTDLVDAIVLSITGIDKESVFYADFIKTKV